MKTVKTNRAKGDGVSTAPEKEIVASTSTETKKKKKNRVLDEVPDAPAPEMKKDKKEKKDKGPKGEVDQDTQDSLTESNGRVLKYIYPKDIVKGDGGAKKKFRTKCRATLARLTRDFKLAKKAAEKDPAKFTKVFTELDTFLTETYPKDMAKSIMAEIDMKRQKGKEKA